MPPPGEWPAEARDAPAAFAAAMLHTLARGPLGGPPGLEALAAETLEGCAAAMDAHLAARRDHFLRWELRSRTNTQRGQTVGRQSSARAYR